MKKLLHAGPGLVIGIPTLGRPVPLDWAFSLKSLNPPANFNTIFQRVQGEEVGHARQCIAEYAVQVDAKYLFFLGDDVVIPPHTLKQLLFRMEHDPKLAVVGGVYCTKCEVPNPLVYRGNGAGCYWDWKIGEYFEVSGMGMDCTLIRVECLKNLEKPWFFTKNTDKYLDGINQAESWTEDLYFFDKLGKTPWKSFIDASVICEHWDVYNNKKYTLPANSLPMRQKVVKRDKTALILSNKDTEVSVIEDQGFDVTLAGSYEDADYRVHPLNLPFAENQFDWVIVMNPGMQLDITEWLRVCRTKLSIAYEPILQRSMIQVAIGREITESGPYVEVMK